MKLFLPRSVDSSTFMAAIKGGAVYPDEPYEGRRNSGLHTCTFGNLMIRERHPELVSGSPGKSFIRTTRDAEIILKQVQDSKTVYLIAARRSEG